MDFKLLAKKKMDFKFKGMKWVGDICQKFEEVCQEVDDIVGQVLFHSFISFFFSLVLSIKFSGIKTHVMAFCLLI